MKICYIYDITKPTRISMYFLCMPFAVAYVFDDPNDAYWCWEEL